MEENCWAGQNWYRYVTLREEEYKTLEVEWLSFPVVKDCKLSTKKKYIFEKMSFT
jgi:hypothetical protein